MFKKWFEQDFSNDSSYLIVCFGSVRMFDGTKRSIEWKNFLKYKFGYLNFKTLFVADINNSWWHTNYYGLDGYGPYVLQDFLFEKIKESGAKKTLFLGTSMGAYGAILFGCLNKANVVFAFSPQTFLTSERRNIQLNRKFEKFNIDENLTDLKKVLETSSNKITEYNIWYGSLNNRDTRAAKRISHIENVYLHSFKSSKHTVVKEVFMKGNFINKMDEFFGVYKK